MPEENGYHFQRCSGEQELHSESVAEPMRMPAFDIGEFKKGVEIPRPVRTRRLWLGVASREEPTGFVGLKL